MVFSLSGVYCSHLVVDDNGEATPGASRQLFRFKHECIEPIEVAMIKLKPAEKFTDLSEVHSLVSDILGQHGFKVVRAEFETDSSDGLVKATFDIRSEE